MRGVDEALGPLSDSDRRALRDLLRKAVAQEPDGKNPLTNGGGGR
jgi:hypothetical protein